MAIDMEAQRSRRAMLATAYATLAAAVSLAIGRAIPVDAAEADPLLLGEDNVSTDATSITRVDSGPALVANASGPGVGCAATTETGIALYGVAGSGQGVVGSSVTGSGVEAISPQGIALRVPRGRIRADGISGVARVARNESFVIVQPAVSIARDAFVLASPMTNLAGRDLWCEVDGETLQIHIDPPADVDIRIAWFLMG